MNLVPLAPYLELLCKFDRPWCIGGGWALDALVGRATREHGDVDIVIWRADQVSFRAHFSTWDWQTFVNREARPWPPGAFLELPAHNARAIREGQELEVLFAEREGDSWWFRRDPTIRMAAEMVMHQTNLGFRVLNPALALLFKSNRLDEKDRHDFTLALPHMAATDRKWLKQALLKSSQSHEWIAKL